MGAPGTLKSPTVQMLVLPFVKGHQHPTVTLMPGEISQKEASLTGTVISREPRDGQRAGDLLGAPRCSKGTVDVQCVVLFVFIFVTQERKRWARAQGTPCTGSKAFNRPGFVLKAMLGPRPKKLCRLSVPA